jgi:hypothetical protein
MRKPQPQQPTRPRMMNAAATAGHYDITIRSLDRWVGRKAFPGPDMVILKRRYWYESTIDEFDRQSTIRRATAAE